MTTTPQILNLKEKRDNIIDWWQQQFPILYQEIQLPVRLKAAIVVAHNAVPSLMNLYDDSHLEIANRYLLDIYNDLVNAKHTEIDPCMVFGRICELKEFIESAWEITDQVLCKRNPNLMKQPSLLYAELDNMAPQRFT